jgi:hypothetical protein
MRAFNRVMVVLLLIGLLLLGAYAVVYAFELFGYRLSDLPQNLGLPGIFSGVEGFVQSVESGSPPIFEIVVLALVAILGLLLLILELKPRTPRRVRMDKGTFIARGVVADEVIQAAESSPNVLGSSATVTPRRKPGVKVQLRTDVRRGEDVGSISSEVQQKVRERMEQVGVPLAGLKVNPVEADPRETKTRVR